MNIIKLIFHKKNKEGFTLIETLVAISILVVSIVGPMEIASRGLFSAFYARDEITAYYLAQEGLEFVRSARDTYYVTKNHGQVDTTWLNVKDTCDVTSGQHGCMLDIISFLPVACSTSDCLKLKYDEESGVFSYDEGVDSKFSRVIKITKESVDDKELLVQSEVKWSPSGLLSSTKSFILEERIFNWQ